MAEDMNQYTVIGYWESDQRHVIGVIQGEHDVMGGTDPGDQGLFAELVEAESWEDAEEMVHGSTEDDEFDSEEEEEREGG